MTNVKLSKLYLITPETLQKIKKNPEKKVFQRKIEKSKGNIDILQVLKNIQREKISTNFKENKNDSENIKRLEAILSDLTSKSSMSLAQKKKSSELGTQTESSDQDQAAQTEGWNEDTILEKQVEFENQETQTDRTENDLDKSLEGLNLSITPKKKPFPAPIVFSGRKLIKKIPKRSASPLIRKLHKVKIGDDAKIFDGSYLSTPLSETQGKREKRMKAIKDLRKLKVCGSRKAKQQAKLKLEQLSNWKHI